MWNPGTRIGNVYKYIYSSTHADLIIFLRNEMWAPAGLDFVWNSTRICVYIINKTNTRLKIRDLQISALSYYRTITGRFSELFKDSTNYNFPALPEILANDFESSIKEEDHQFKFAAEGQFFIPPSENLGMLTKIYPFTAIKVISLEIREAGPLF
jgi:hypothetical protein